MPDFPLNTPCDVRFCAPAVNRRDGWTFQPGQVNSEGWLRVLTPGSGDEHRLRMALVGGDALSLAQADWMLGAMIQRGYRSLVDKPDDLI